MTWTGAAWADVRLEALGYRQLVPRGSLAAAASVLPPAAPAELHGLLSALLGVPDGAADLPSGECVPHESNLELLGGTAGSKCPPPPYKCPSSAPEPPQDAPGGSGQLGAPRARPVH